MYRIKKPKRKSRLLKCYIKALIEITRLKGVVKTQKDIMIAKEKQWEKITFSNLEAITKAKEAMARVKNAYEALKKSFDSTRFLYEQERKENKELQRQNEELRKRLKEHGITR